MSKKRKKEKIVQKPFRVQPKTEGQEIYWEALNDNNISYLCVTGPSGCGKAQPLEATIQTTKGPVLMKDIKIGDEAICPDGSSSKVTGIFPQGEKEVYRVITSGGGSTECCLEHLWATCDILEEGRQKTAARTRYRDEFFPGKPVKSIKLSEVPDFELKTTVKTTEELKNTLVHGGTKNHKLPKITPYEYPEGSIKLDPYILGTLIGDGSLSQFRIKENSKKDRVVFTTNQKFISFYSELLKSKLIEYNYVEDARNLAVDFRLYGLGDLVHECGLSGKYSWNKAIPEKYLLASSKTRLELLRGLMDTDGSSASGCGCYYSTSCRDLAKQIQWLVESLGGTATLSEPQKASYMNEQGVRVECRDKHRLYINIPLCPFHLPDKKNKWTEGNKNKQRQGYRVIEDIQLVGKKECQCISIDHPDSLYLTDNHIPTHNTLLAAQAAADGFLQKKFSKIYLTRSITAVDGEKIGHLPGDAASKMDPWLACISQHLKKVLPNYKYLTQTNQIEVVPITYLRGMSLDNAFVIVSEAQNLTMEVIKCIMTRLDFRSKVVFDGDFTQADKNKTNNPYEKFCKLFEDQLDSFEWVKLSPEDIVRSRNIIKILEIFDTLENATGN